MIYFLRHIETGLIKIGFTNDFDTRYGTLIETFGILDIMGVLDGNMIKERLLHLRFAPANVRGVLRGREWFYPVPDLLKHIEANARSHAPGKLPRKFQVRSNIIDCGTVKVVNHLPELVKEYERVTGKKRAQVEIAIESGVNKATLNHYINGKISGVDLEIEEKLCRYFSQKLKRPITRNDLFSFTSA